MSTFEQLRRHLDKAWDTVTEGWNYLRERAGQALTLFRPLSGRQDVDTWEDQVVRRSADWALLATEIQEDEDKVTVRMEVPGMEQENFDIDIRDGYLVVRGEKRARREQQHGHYHVMECAYGSFERALPLPSEVDAGAAKAGYRRGVLSIELPKHAHARRRRIPISGT